MFLVNKYGQTIFVENEKAALEHIAKDGMRRATKLEISIRTEERSQAYSEARAKLRSALPDIYYKTVPKTPDGYGMSAGIIASELERYGTHANELFNNQKVGLLYAYPYAVTQMQTDVRLIYTMFESDKIPADWVEYLQSANEVIVPSHWCQDVFAKRGIKTTVVPLGYNDRVFKYIDRTIPEEKNEPFTFIHYNGFNMRKGFAELLKAFVAEFTPQEPVRLIIKTTQPKPPIPLPKGEYPNIEVVCGEFTEVGLNDLLGRANCFVYPSRGEGFGITPLEAMATGLPAIIPNAHGISEYFDPKYCMEVKVGGYEPALYSRYKGEDVGDMAVCDVDDLRAKMRWAYTHQKDMYKLGREASVFARSWTYKKTARGLQEVIDRWNDTDVVRRPESDFLVVDRI